MKKLKDKIIYIRNKEGKIIGWQHPPTKKEKRHALQLEMRLLYGKDYEKAKG